MNKYISRSTSVCAKFLSESSNIDDILRSFSRSSVSAKIYIDFKRRNFALHIGDKLKNTSVQLFVRVIRLYPQWLWCNLHPRTYTDPLQEVHRSMHSVLITRVLSSWRWTSVRFLLAPWDKRRCRRGAGFRDRMVIGLGRLQQPLSWPSRRAMSGRRRRMGAWHEVVISFSSALPTNARSSLTLQMREHEGASWWRSNEVGLLHRDAPSPAERSAAQEP